MNCIPVSEIRLNPARRGYDYQWRKKREKVLADNRVCVVCRQTPSDTVDHIIPKRAGGTDAYDNLQAVCRSCHSRKTALCDFGFGRAPLPPGSRPGPKPVRIGPRKFLTLLALAINDGFTEFESRDRDRPIRSRIDGRIRSGGEDDPFFRIGFRENRHIYLHANLAGAYAAVEYTAKRYGKAITLPSAAGMRRELKKRTLSESDLGRTTVRCRFHGEPKQRQFVRIHQRHLNDPGTD